MLYSIVTSGLRLSVKANITILDENFGIQYMVLESFILFKLWFQWMKDVFLQHFVDWETSVRTRINPHTQEPFSKEEQNRMLFSYQTIEGLRTTGDLTNIKFSMISFQKYE